MARRGGGGGALGVALALALAGEALLVQVALGGPLVAGGVEGDAAQLGDGGEGVGFEFVEVGAADGAVLAGVVVFDFGGGLRGGGGRGC